MAHGPTSLTQNCQISGGTDRVTPCGYHTWALLAVLLVVAGFSLGFWSDGPVQGRRVSAVRVPITHEPLHKDAPPTIREGHEGGGASMGGIQAVAPMSLDRAQFRATVRQDQPEEWGVSRQSGLPTGQHRLIDFNKGVVSLNSTAGSIAIPLLREAFEYQSFSFPLMAFADTAHDMRPLLASDDEFFSESLTAHRTPSNGWNAGLFFANECRAAMPVSNTTQLRSLMFRLGISIAGDSLKQRADKYQNTVARYAQRFGLSSHLIYAIMRTESAYNPFAVSHAGALGLMQLMPQSAGGEVHAYLTGKSGVPTGSMLFDPEQNIQYGSAYLHLLSTRHFGQISNQASRELCVIAAYNGGPGAVLRVFGPSKEVAVAAINALTPEAVHAQLTRMMPAEESRLYVDKVLGFLRALPES